MNSFFHSFVFFFLWVYLVALPYVAGFTLYMVPPSTTDPNINTYDGNSYAYYPGSNDGPLKNPLFFFVPGTSSTPSDYSFFLDFHAALGYRVISIDYPNEKTVNDYCQNTPSTGTCYSDVRNEILTGQDSSNLLTVTVPNSINNRLYKLLVYLTAQYPADNWNDFINGTSILWENIVVVGHSQGSGHAAYIGVLFNTTRVIQYGGCTDLYSDGTSPSWTLWPSATPYENFYGFRSKYEFVCSGAKSNWINFQMPTYGDVIDIDTLTISGPAAFANSHQICSSYKPKVGVQPLGLGLVAHIVYIVNGLIKESRIPLYEGVWLYMSTLQDCGTCPNGTYCSINSTCISLSTVFTESVDPCLCDEGPLVNPSFLAVVIVVPLIFVLACVGVIVGCIVHRRRKRRLNV